MKPIRWNDGSRWNDPNLRWGNPSYRLEPGDPGYIPTTPPRTTMNTRKFKGTLSGLLLAGDQLKDAVIDTDYAAAIAERLGDSIATTLTTQLGAVRHELEEQSGKTGDAGSLTQQQQDALAEVERLTAGARRTARLAFPGQDVLLHSEFQVGIDTPKTLAAELTRAGLIKAACTKYTATLQTKGWLARDTTALGAAIATCGGSNTEQGEAFADRAEMTADLIRAANALYDTLLTVQNAARLEYPSTQPDTEAARARFLLNTFPPRDRSHPDGGTEPPNTPPTP
jgi:hypothetical protein